MKIYLAGPMTGLPHFNRPAFDEAARRLRQEGHEVWSPAEFAGEVMNSTGDEEQAALAGFSIRQAMATQLRYICLNADAIAMLPGWENSGGCRTEWAVATRLKLKIIYL